MAQGYNKVVLIGYLGRAPEMRYTPHGKPVTSFSIVSTQTCVASDGMRHDESDWFNVVAWGTLAEECKNHLRKGQHVLVEGRMKNRHWIDDDQIERSCAEVIAMHMVPLQNDQPRTSLNN